MSALGVRIRPPIGKSGPLTLPHRKALDGRFRVVDQEHAGVDDLSPEVVRRDFGRHADGDPLGAVDQELGKASR